MGVIVYGTGTGNVARMHRSPDCAEITRNGRQKLPVQAFDLDDLLAPFLCLKCFPDQPKVQVKHARCTVCPVGARPCRHNGGVRVTDGIRHFYVWPERAHFYTLANSGLQS